MAYAVRRRRISPGLAGAYPICLGDDSSDGFSWSGFFTNIGTSAAKGAAQAGISRLTQAIAGAPKPVAVATAPAAPTAALGSIPMWGWAVGGMGLVLILVIAMGRR